MKIAIPSESDAGLESMRSGHFGHGGVIAFAISLGIDGILCAGMGIPPFTRFTYAGIKVYRDGTQPSVGDVVRLFAAGEVDLMDPSAACRH